MDQLENILLSDDRIPYSMGSLEKEVAYVTVLAFSIPILLLPLLHRYVGGDVYKLTLLLVAFLVGLLLMVYHQFHWIVWLSDHFHTFSKARL